MGKPHLPSDCYTVPCYVIISACHKKVKKKLMQIKKNTSTTRHEELYENKSLKNKRFVGYNNICR